MRGERLADAYPPPYRLTCDLAVFPVLASSSRLQARGLPAFGLAGRCLAFVTVARYASAVYGAHRMPFPRGQLSGKDFYREVAIIILRGLLPGFSFSFPQLWVDSPDAAPLELGWRYGFPKGSAAISVEQDADQLRVESFVEDGSVLSLAAGFGANVPAIMATALAFGEGVFPLARQKARLRLDGGEGARLLSVRQWNAPALERWGITGPPRFGLWLKDTVLSLGRPTPITTGR